jgi:hypothetical protein
LDDVPQELIVDCAQLVKANSIEVSGISFEINVQSFQGCKLNDINVVYTMSTNLKKTGDMVVGQIGFYKDKDVKKVSE